MSEAEKLIADLKNILGKDFESPEDMALAVELAVGAIDNFLAEEGEP